MSTAMVLAALIGLIDKVMKIFIYRLTHLNSPGKLRPPCQKTGAWLACTQITARQQPVFLFNI